MNDPRVTLPCYTAGDIVWDSLFCSLMAAVGSLQLSNELGTCMSHRCSKQFQVWDRHSVINIMCRFSYYFWSIFGWFTLLYCQNVTGTYRSTFLGFKFKPHVFVSYLILMHFSFFIFFCWLCCSKSFSLKIYLKRVLMFVIVKRIFLSIKWDNC